MFGFFDTPEKDVPYLIETIIKTKDEVADVPPDDLCKYFALALLRGKVVGSQWFRVELDAQLWCLDKAYVGKDNY